MQPNNGKQPKSFAVADRQKSAGSVQSSTDDEVAPPSPKEDSTTTRLRQLLPTAWNMIRPYWSSDDRWAAWGLLTVVIALTLAMVHMSVLFNHWNNAFYTALQDKNHTVFFRQLIGLSWLVGLTILFAVYQLYLSQMLEIRWRRWLTERYLRAWLTDGAYYRMQLEARQTDNPDQRIAEDVHLLISHTLTLVIGGLRALVTLATFVAILWTLSGTLTVPLAGFSIILPGYMVWMALLYSIGGTWFTHWIGRPLIRLNFERQRYEADFRFSLVRFRENTEGVALYRGEADELRGFRERFEAVVRNWWGIMRRQKRLTYFTSGYVQAAWIFPSITAAPRYFRGELGLGGLMQTIGAFNYVQDALSFVVQSYKEIAAWSSVVERLSGFERALERVRIQAAAGGGVRWADGRATHLTVEGVNLYLPDGQPLIANVNLSLSRGDTDATLREALQAVGLTELAGRLDESGHWAHQLSPGEQQRIAFAQALVQKPDWLFLDEATSAVDEPAEERLYRLLHERLVETTVFSVGHRATLHPFHARHLLVQPNGNSPASVVEVTAAPESGRGVLLPGKRA